MQDFICSSDPVVGRALGRGARALPVGVTAVAQLVPALPQSPLLGSLGRGLHAPHHLRGQALLRRAGRGRHTLPAELEGELALAGAALGRVRAAVLVVQVLLRRRLRRRLLARLLRLRRGQLLLGLALPRAVGNAVELALVPLGREPVAAVHRPLVVLRREKGTG